VRLIDPGCKRPPAPRLLTHGQVSYHLVRRLGAGAMGEVYSARAVGGGVERWVCIKRLAGRLDPEDAVLLREEARILASVRHANVLAFLAVGEEADGEPFLVLELVEGLDLKALCAARANGDRLPDMVAVHIACALLRALAAVQRYLPGLVHRDVTPHNVLVSTHGEVKLADFGIALARDRTRWTQPLFVKGKVGYMSPEQILGAEIDGRTDQFAVGVILYELIAGERPWGVARGAGELRAVVEERPRPLPRGRSRMDRALAGVVMRLIARRPEDRYRSPEDALRALAPFGAGELGSLRLASIVDELHQANAATTETRATEREER
jgi:eukaryotic-like serine/threonine-protein kinase